MYMFYSTFIREDKRRNTPMQVITRQIRKNLPLITLALILFGLGFGPFSSTRSVHAAASVYTPPASNRVDLDLNADWKFHLGDVTGAQNTSFDDSSWSSISVPHTWNNLDGEDGGSYTRDTGWYRKHYTVSSSYANRRLFLQFDGSNQVTDVYVNGIFLGEHQGGYATFRFDATAAMNIGGDNVIAVKVNNAYNADIAPLSADYTFFGGIYRTVHLVVVDPVHLRMLDYGSSGLYLKQSNVSSLSADLQVTVEIANDNSSAQTITLTTVIVDAGNNVVQTLTSQQTLAANTTYNFVQSTTISNPTLWNAKQNPYLYHVTAQLQVGSTITDVVTQPLGFRYFRLDANQGFILNGSYLDLHGVDMHQDRQDKGWAVSSSDLDEDFGLAMEIGATAIRMSHYEHDQHIYDLSDNNGMVIWAEIPVINNVTNSTAFTSNTEQQLKELIRQNYNHPSIMFWSIGNEIKLSPDPNPLLSDLNSLAHTEDPTRITTYAVCCVSDTDPTSLHTDTRGYNKYYGWYYGSYNDFDSWATNFHNSNPNLTFAISEYGAGASIYQHQDNPGQPTTTDYYHPEEYQALLHEAIWQSMAQKPYIWGKFVWNLFDFASDGRDEGDQAGRNDKGLVTYDRQTRKDAFYWYKANWSSSPFTYITDRRFTNRSLSTTTIKIYSNTSSVSVSLNGVSLGSKTSSNHIFTWPNVTLALGDNIIQATGTLNGNTYSDSVTWNYTPNERISSGARMPYTDTTGKVFDVDHFYSGGTVKSTSATIANTTDQPEYQTYRYGTFNYTIPLENGTYYLYLKFMDPFFSSSGSRVFSVTAQGQTILSNEDIYQEVGKNAALQKKFTVTVTNGQLNLNFTPSVNNAIVSAIALVKQ
jgi:beta-galactosidase